MPLHRAPTNPIERQARSFLPKLLQEAGRHGDFPCDYVLVLAKYDPKSGLIVPREKSGEFLDYAKSEARRRKYERLLASPCEKNELLILLCAGDHIEGHWMRVPALVPSTTPNGTAREHMSLEAERYMRMHLGRVVHEIRKRGEQPRDWMVISRDPEAPMVLRRSRAREPLEMTGFADEILRELTEPASDDEVFCVQPDAEGLSWFRLRPAIPTEVEPTEEGMKLFAMRLAKESKAALEQFGEKPTEYLGYFRWPPADGKTVEPLICPRIELDVHLSGVCSARKLQQIKDLLADPYDGIMVFMDAADSEDIRFTFVDDGQFQREANAMLAEFLERQGLT